MGFFKALRNALGQRPDVTLVYEDEAGKWRWRRVAPNGEIIADSAESYTRKFDAKRAADRVFDPPPVEQ